MQCYLMCSPAKVGDSILAILPIFHGFGLGVSIHTTLYVGMKVILVPDFSPRKFGGLIKKYNPDHFAIEELFYHSNQKTVINVAMARGVTVLAATKFMGADKLYEYTPLQIKQARTGNGRAEKQQVQFMVKAILNLNKIPKPDDAADALAVSLCHSQTNLILSNTDIK